MKNDFGISWNDFENKIKRECFCNFMNNFKNDWKETFLEFLNFRK